MDVIEELRVQDKSARRIRTLGIGRISDDLWQDTPAGNSAAVTQLTQPLRAMAVLGEIKPIAEGDFTVSWPTATNPKVTYKIRLPNSPKEITNEIVLDTGS